MVSSRKKANSDSIVSAEKGKCSKVCTVGCFTVAIARAFASDAPILFADEPTGNLDTRTGAKVIDLLFELNQEQGRTLVLVTHEQRLADRCARVLELSAGALVSDQSKS